MAKQRRRAEDTAMARAALATDPWFMKLAFAMIAAAIAWGAADAEIDRLKVDIVEMREEITGLRQKVGSLEVSVAINSTTIGTKAPGG